ncbi:MAG: hypothetical protein HUJ55_04030 [Ileibacterium sp.]|nr:hypothetical protein [Ileibacterium sp.]
MSDALFWVVAAIIVAMGVFSNYTNWKQYKASKEAKEIFMKNHKDAEVTELPKTRVWLFAGLCVLCLGLAVLMSVVKSEEMSESTRWSQVLVYAGLSVFCFAMVPEALMDAKLVHTPDGFMYGDFYFRFKHMVGIVQSHNFLKSDKAILTGNKEEIIPKPVAKWAEPALLEYQARRKAARKKGRNR